MGRAESISEPRLPTREPGPATAVVRLHADDGCDYARWIGWGIGPRSSHLVIENNEAGNGRRSLSVFKRRRITLPDGRTELRTVRPGFRRALAMLADGRGRLDRPRS